MAVNTKIFDRIVQELTKEKSRFPYAHEVYDETTKRRYVITIQTSETKNFSLNESRISVESMATQGAGQQCGCCGGSGKVG